MNPEIVLSIIKLSLCGIVAFLSICVMSKTRSASWMFLVAGFLSYYAVIVYELMLSLGIISACPIIIKAINLPLDSLLTVCIPNLFFIFSFVFKLCKK